MPLKAQASMELIIIISVIIGASVAVLGFFNSIQNSTVALGLAKANTLEAVSKSQIIFTIDRISLDETGLVLAITTKPELPPETGCRDINAQGTKNLIVSKGLYPGTLAVTLNGANC